MTQHRMPAVITKANHTKNRETYIVNEVGLEEKKFSQKKRQINIGT